MWAAYDTMGRDYQQHAADGAYNAHYDRPAVLAALGPIRGLRVLDAACGPGLYTQELVARGAPASPLDVPADSSLPVTSVLAGRPQVD